MKHPYIIALGCLIVWGHLAFIAKIERADPLENPTTQEQHPAERRDTAQSKPTATLNKSGTVGILKIGDRFAGVVALRTKDNKTRPVQVTIHDWVIRDHQKIEKFPELGFLVFHLRAGELATVINGVKQKRNEDEFWMVPSGMSIGFETDRDTASLQVWSVKKP